jgi:hypothetical protein
LTWDASSEDSFDVKEPHVELELDVDDVTGVDDVIGRSNVEVVVDDGRKVR